MIDQYLYKWIECVCDYGKGNRMKKYNLIVAGGGLTGVAAAVSAAREGLSVLLIEKAGCLGGSMSNCQVYPYMKYWMKNGDNDTMTCLSAGIFTEMRKRHAEMTGVDELSRFGPEYYKFLLDDMVTEAGVDVLFHTSVFGVFTEGKKVKGVRMVSKSGIMEMEAEYFIDATGDGDLMALAGCEFQLGREEDGLCQPMTTCFRMSGVDVEKLKEERPRLQKLYQQYRANGKITNPRENILMFFGIGDDIVHFNTTRIVKHNPVDVFDMSKAEMAARRQVREMAAFLQANSSAFTNSTIISIASEIGVRESRKLKGMYILTGEDLKNCVEFEDAIALGNYEIDIHNPAGTGTTIIGFQDSEYYQIPYRSLLPKEYTNLLVAGRCLSATHEAQAAVRIMPICACMGEAAGMAVSVAWKSGSDAHKVDIKEVRRKLQEGGATL